MSSPEPLQAVCRVRPAVLEDLDFMRALDREVDPRPWSREQFASLFKARNYLCMVAVEAGQCLGFLVASTVADEAELQRIAVVPARRRQGIARQLLLALFSTLNEGGVSRCFLEVRAANQAAIACYRALGFRPTGRRRGYYAGTDGGREDALLFCCESPA